MNKEELKQQVCLAIANRKADIKAIAEAIWAEPELGYKEHKTAKKVEQTFEKLGVPYKNKLALTGVKGRLKGGKGSKYSIAVIGELDAIICADHPAADETSGAAHCCGHNAQIANMMAVTMGLIDSGAMQYLAGDVVPFAVPAEEYVEITYRNRLIEEGKIKYIGGKPELISRGEFDDVDMALQIHLTSVPNERKDGFIEISTTSNGFIGKLIKYKGEAAHAAAAPHAGVNALNAAMMGLMGVNAIRDTFQEKDYIRFHPIITQGGDLVNVVPSDVRMESYVRAGNVPAMIKANERINQALQAGAMAVGASCEIKDLPGYLPLHNNATLNELLKHNAEKLIGEENVSVAPHMTGSTDTGDLSHIMPVSHPWIGSVRGVLHGKDYVVFDEEMAYIRPAQMMACTIIDLLFDDAKSAQTLISNYKPLMTKEEYLTFLSGFDK
ncbi:MULTISPECIES: amidohydrolase [unclassified Gilliamella]|uniref:amidohydrolase n=1 Tax=unclassified Gilliamella TaxID=2685620 RepID=UPI002269D976|nr:MULTISPECIES: amidohydrolase [unclassified Gilliamella]MCX8643128.1 amidohydrolase [Gilliamella sp. B3835]MCX8708519.1 amidohydrolase [Gilliamella sp. B3783]MCX8709564.1 amidohydrolase [Gilliamella sp. B3780]MCX8715305.1 amidohydrolase [Gilliamella sp. B3781]MCX8717715.1 amidohydrolase [Gilliamella sp. B3784]